MTEQTNDPTRQWNGEQWMRWDGVQWLPEQSHSEQPLTGSLSERLSAGAGYVAAKHSARKESKRAEAEAEKEAQDARRKEAELAAASAPQILEAKGVNGTLQFDGRWVTILRKGALARGTIGKGEKRIPVTQVSSVQWKAPGAVVNGYISFSLAGNNDSRSKFGRATHDATRDENAVIVASRHAKEFLQIKEAIEEAIFGDHSSSRPVPGPVPVASTPPPPPPSAIPAGWYPRGDVQQYWDGSTWTDHTAPRVER